MAQTLTRNRTTINIKVDKDIKKQVDAFSTSIGIPVSTMVNSYFRTLAETRRFEAVEYFKPNAETAKLLRQSMEEYKNGDYETSNLDDFLKKAKTGKL